MHCVKRWLPLSTAALAILLAPGPGVAGPVASAGAPSFDATLASRQVAARGGLWIEAITVEGLRHARSELVLAESLLVPGRSYTEGQLRDAADRLRRLPFLLDARMSLARGSRRGWHELVISVLEVERFFYGVDLRHTAMGSSPGSRPSRQAPLPGVGTAADGGALDSSLSGLADVTEAAVALGGRWFVGPASQVFAGWDREGLQVGWAHHDLGPRHVFASVQLSARDGCCQERVLPLGLDPGFGAWSLEDTRQARLEVAVPLSARRAVRLTASSLEAGRAGREALLEAGTQGEARGGLEVRRATLSWLHDDTDDPLLPGRGLVMSATLAHRVLETAAGRTGELPASSHETSLGFAATRHLPVAPRQTVSLGGRASLGRGAMEKAGWASSGTGPRSFTTWATAAGVRWSYDLRPRAVGDWRLELGAGWSRQGTSGDSIAGLSPAGELAPLEAVEHVQGEVAVVYRHAWGVVRLAFAYLELDEVGR